MANLVNSNTSIFESIKRTEGDGLEYWYARELMKVLGYKTWEGFHEVIRKAELSLLQTYPQASDHFRQLSKKIKIAVGTNKEAVRKITDYELTRRACYLIAQNGDSKKEPIALAQNYFASQTRKQELAEIKEKDFERIVARRKLTETEKKFAGVINKRGVDGRGIAEIKSAGDTALFGSPTNEVKKLLGIKQTKPLADHLPTISIVRAMLNENGIYPERLPAEEDVKRLEKKYSQDEISSSDVGKILTTGILEIDIRGIFDKQRLLQIRNLIANNLGDSKLVIYYGDNKEIKIIEKDIQINAEVINALREYLVITENMRMN